MPAERVLLVPPESDGRRRIKQAQSVAFSENLDELKGSLVLTGPIDEDDARSACEFLARASESLEERQVGDSPTSPSLRRASSRPVGTKAVEIPSLPVHVPILGTSAFSLPAQTQRADRHPVGASKINRHRLPVVCVRFPQPWQFLAHQPKTSDWRPTLNYARTVYDRDYAPDPDQFKLNLVYVVPRFTG
jgi:hypothetical protein